jgi:selenium-binding protein 1
MATQTWKPDPTFYPSPRMAMEAPPETIAYVAALRGVAGGGAEEPDAMTVVDVDPSSSTYSQLVSTVEMPNVGDELHHFGWNACSASLCPYAPHPHVERRYLVVPGSRSSRIHILDTKPDPRNPRIVKVIEPQEVFDKTNYRALHTFHCGPEGIYGSGLGAPDGGGPGGVFVMDHDDFELKGQWEVDRGTQELAYDFWWHLGSDTMISSEWGTPNMVEDGLDPELLLGGNYGHKLHVWDLRNHKHVQEIDLGPQQQMVLELRPAHDPSKEYGFAGVVVSLEDLSASIWMWYLDPGTMDWTAKRIIQIPAQPADPEQLPPLLQGFKAVPPLISDINLSLDDRFLYISCWGTGELQQWDVSNPTEPVHTGTVKLGGIVNRTPHPSASERPLIGGPQMLEVSRDGRRVYFTNSLYSAWDGQFYPDWTTNWMAKVDAAPGGGISMDGEFFVDFGDLRSHQVRLEGGDSSSDSFCYPG